MIFKNITKVFTGLLLFANVLLGLLLYFQFDKQLTEAWISRYHVPLGNLAQEIEYGLQLGFSLETMENLPKLLSKITLRYPEISHLFVSNSQGKIITHTPEHKTHNISISPLLANFEPGKDINGISLIDEQKNHILVWSVNNPFGSTDGFVFMELPWAELQAIRNLGIYQLVIGIAGVISIFTLLSIGLFWLILKKLIHHPQNTTIKFKRSSFQTHILATALILLLGSCVASTIMGYFIFRDLYLPTLYSQSRIIGQSLSYLASEMYSHGIPINKMRGLPSIFNKLMTDYPQIAAIGLYDANNQELQLVNRNNNNQTAIELSDPHPINIPIISYEGTAIGAMRLAKVPYFFATKLFDIALDVLALLVVSILIATELLVFMVRFLIAVPMKKLASNSSQQSSPLMSYVRPPLFLVVFADALSLSFFPMYVSSLLTVANSWFSKELLIGLPISAFMLVWAISLPIVGQWSDRVGRRHSLLIGSLLTAMGLVLTVFVYNFWQLILVRSITAIGYGIVYISAQSYIADHTTALDRTKGMAMFLGGFFSGSLCGAALGGILADR
ncbi:hypothetical protein TI03_03190, partial [Achromatium sp. WMS1]